MTTISTDLYADITFTLIKCELFDNIVDLLLTNSHVNHIGRSVVQCAYRHAIQQPPNIIDMFGVKSWLKNGYYHRNWDLPALITFNHKQWFTNHKCHRAGDKPAIIYRNGSKEWYTLDLHHRNGDKPASIYADGSNEWFVNDLLHRDGGKPAVIYADGRHALGTGPESPGLGWRRPTQRHLWFKHGVQYTPKKLKHQTN